MSRRAARVREQAGFSLVMLIGAIALMMILMSAGIPSWKYVMKDAKEEELIFRGQQIADAIKRFQDKNGGALPPTLEVLVKGKFLRKEFKDPMTEDGKWNFIQGMPGGPGGGHPPPAHPPGTPEPPQPSPDPAAQGGPTGRGGMRIGGITGVTSRSREKSLRIVNGRERYDQWQFIAGQKVVVGPQIQIVVPPGGSAPNLGHPQGKPNPNPNR